ncbi:hypothetical protein LJC32_02010 [Oscillospiraceae bacterium OttesenSCG-928-F05]|nr:hypothetical protein [Oscillospiraceae bacterium OttesenSCG-928-F05]
MRKALDTKRLIDQLMWIPSRDTEKQSDAVEYIIKLALTPTRLYLNKLDYDKLSFEGIEAAWRRYAAVSARIDDNERIARFFIESNPRVRAQSFV